MPSDYKLPFKDNLGFCNVLFSALGGDGANMGAKLMFKTGVLEFGLDGGYDAKYGSEKKGTATDVSVRFCEPGTPVRQSGPTETPHILVAFHDDLIQPLDLGRGLFPGASVIANSIEPPAKIREFIRLHSGTITCIDATRIAYETRSRLNMPLVAGACHALGFPDEQMKQIIAKQWPKAVKANLAAYDQALANAKAETFAADGKFELRPPLTYRGPLGWKNMLNGGTIDALTHNTFRRDNRIAGRGHIPVFHEDACTSCGICLTVCSDPGGLLWKQGRMTGIDDRFCKGCMRCVEVCPETKKGKALTAESV